MSVATIDLFVILQSQKGRSERECLTVGEGRVGFKAEGEVKVGLGFNIVLL
jgi:hypothetical protein